MSDTQAAGHRIKLSGAQVTRVQEALTRYHENCRTTDYDTKAAYIPPQIATEDLVNDILDVVMAVQS